MPERMPAATAGFTPLRNGVNLLTVLAMGLVGPAKYDTAADFNASFHVPPAALVTKALAMGGGTPIMVRPTVTAMRPMGLANTFLTTGLTALCTALTTLTKPEALATLLTVPLTAFVTLLNAFFREKNSGSPVSGLIVPEPPRERSKRASAGVICASMVSP